MQPNKKEQRNKELLGTVRKLNELATQRFQHRRVPCTPYQYGWFMDWVLRDEYKHHPEAEIFQRILGKINGRVWSMDPEFKASTQRRRNKHEVILRLLPVLKPITVRFDPFTGEIGWPVDWPQSYKKWFYFHPPHADCSCFPRGADGTVQYYRPAHYCFRQPWRFETKVRPAIVSTEIVVNGDLDSQISYLQRKLDLTHAWPIISRLSGRKVARRDDRRQKLIARAVAREA